MSTRDIAISTHFLFTTNHSCGAFLMTKPKFIPASMRWPREEGERSSVVG